MNSSITKRRGAVIINYLCLAVILIVFYYVKFLAIQRIYLLSEIIPVIGLIISFKIAFSKSDSWKLAHKSFSMIDEKEMQIVYKAITYSYSIFSILCIALIYIHNLFRFELVDVTLATCLLYFAHMLPASIIAWNEEI